MQKNNKFNKKTRTETYLQSTIKIGVMVMFILFLISFTSALTTKNFQIDNERSLGATQYGTITLKDRLFIDLFGWWEKPTKEITLLENSEQCLIDCDSYGTTTLFEEGKLFDDFKFLNNNKKSEQLNYVVYVKIEEIINYEVPTYKEVCSEDIKNNSCYNEINGYETKQKIDINWKEYNYEVLPAGEYEWKLKAKKSKAQGVDWIGVIDGKELDEWAWWDNDWTIKKEIKIQENSGNDYINYTVNMTVTYDANMQGDFDDLRFLDSTESDELEYWIEEFTDSTSAIVWVKIPTMSAGLNSTIYMYYGNPTATNNSDYKEAHLFADNFGDGDYTTDWTDSASSSTVSEAGGSLSYKSDTGGANVLRTKLNYTYDDGGDWILEVKGQSSSSTAGDFVGIGTAEGWGTDVDIQTADGNQDKLGMYWVTNVPYWRQYESNNGAWAETNGINVGSPVTAQRTMQLIRNGTNIYGYSDGSYSGLRAINFANASMGVTILARVGATFTVDYVELKRYADTEPTVVFGSEESVSANANIELISPENDYLSTINSVSFNASLTPINANLTNATIYIWDFEYNIFNETTNEVTGNVINYTQWTISNFNPGDYDWNVKGCYVDSSDINIHNCSLAISNMTFTVGSALTNISYNTQTYETSTETFRANFSIVEGSEISLAQLVYNGTNYTISDISITGTNLSLSKVIDIPLVGTEFVNETKSFFFRFTYDGGSSQESDTYEQNISFINLQKCNTTFPTEALNYTMYDELSQNIIVSATNKSTLESYFKYWTGTGTITKNYSFQNLTSTMNSYTFCIYPYNENITFKTDNDIIYSALDYRENQYHLRNATLTNVSNDIQLFLMPETEATKFFLTFQKGTDLISDATVNVQKYFTGLGTYKTVAILLTDSDGKTTMWKEIDKQYRYSVVKDGTLLGSSERISSCSVAPCSMTVTLPTDSTNLFEDYYNTYSTGVLSNLSFNKTSKIVKYDFIDTTGLANHFRLEVNEIRLNKTKNTVCDSTSYSVAGILTCNLSAYSDSEFTARGYISRSPEILDTVLGIIISETFIEGLGLIAVFLVMGLLITIVFAAAVVTRGSPSGVLWALAGGILILKLMNFFPFTWTITIPLLFLILFMISKVKV